MGLLHCYRNLMAQATVVPSMRYFERLASRGLDSNVAQFRGQKCVDSTRCIDKKAIAIAYHFCWRVDGVADIEKENAMRLWYALWPR